MIDGGMVSIAKVTITPDLFEARIYLSFFQIKNPDALLQKIKDRAWEIKKELTASVRHQLRSMPQLQFFIDDTLEYVFKMEELFKEIQMRDDFDIVDYLMVKIDYDLTEDKKKALFMFLDFIKHLEDEPEPLRIVQD